MILDDVIFFCRFGLPLARHLSSIELYDKLF